MKNPDGGEAVTHRSPQAIMEEIAALDAESAKGWQASGSCYESSDSKEH